MHELVQNVLRLARRVPSQSSWLIVVLNLSHFFASAVPLYGATTTYYFHYGLGSDETFILDESGNGHDLATYFDGTFAYAPLSAPVPIVGSARAFDVASSLDIVDGLKKGGLTDQDPIGETEIIAAGGFTFETWIRRNPNDGLGQHIWNPEGMHSIEILGSTTPGNQSIQLALRGITSWTLPVNNILPANEWHHLMAVMATTNGTGGVTYRMLIDGHQVGATLTGNLFSSFTTLEGRNERHGIGWNEFGAPANGFNGQLAYSRLSLGVVDYADSLAFGRNIPGTIVGDFNQDGLYGCSDIDGLVAAVAAGTNPPAFDLNGDALVNQVDLSAWLTNAGAANLPSGSAYLPGDGNLDGVVDGSDFGIWNGRKFTSTAAWCGGDFNADGIVDGSDFGIWNTHKFQSSDFVTVVPEAMQGWMVACMALLLWSNRRLPI